MRKLITIFSIMATLILFVACGGGSKPAEAEQSKEAAPAAAKPSGKKVAIVYSTGGKGDKSFNDAAFRGLEKAQKELGIEFKEYEPKDAAGETKDALNQFAETGEYELIIAIGFNLKDSLIAVAESFPDQKFAIVDESVELPNVASLKFKEHEGSFLVGAVAAMMTKSNNLGFVGAVEIPILQKFEAGYVQGAKYINPDIKVTSVWLGGNNPFNDPAAAKAKTETLIQQGADVIYHAAGGSGAGMFQAVKEKSIYGIGVDSNQDAEVPGFVLTSMMKYVDVAVFNTIKDTLDGKFEAKLKEFGIKEDGIGTTNFEFTKDKIGEENLKKLEQIKNDIKEGKITVKETK